MKCYTKHFRRKMKMKCNLLCIVRDENIWAFIVYQCNAFTTKHVRKDKLIDLQMVSFEWIYCKVCMNSQRHNLFHLDSSLNNTVGSFLLLKKDFRYFFLFFWRYIANYNIPLKFKTIFLLLSWLLHFYNFSKFSVIFLRI